MGLALFSVTESDALHARARAFIACSLRGDPQPERFDALALDLARFQAACIPSFARLVRARGVDLATARAASAIPAVPTDVFRLARLAAHPASLDTALFRTSGTTQGARGEHPLRTTATYELGALGWGQRFLWPDGPELSAVVLAPPVVEQPDSSLGFMLDRFTRALAGPASFHVRLAASGEATLDVEGVARAVAHARALGRPAIVLATSFALVHLLDQAHGIDLRLPEKSRIMQTGGFKGRSREVAPDELCAQVARAFCVPQPHVVGEYGMTELSSQLYEGTLAAALGLSHGGARRGVYAPPPWMRVDAVDPETLSLLPPGEVGVARFVDLANVDSIVAVQTADRVRVTAEGVELLGRLPGATPRGCSIALDEMLGGA